MLRSPAAPGRSAGRSYALVGLAGAALAAVGDVLILGRPASGVDFDRAAGTVPPHVEVSDRWRSLWNGTALSRRRNHVGTLSGAVGISLLSWFGLGGAARQIHAGSLRKVAAVSAAAFAGSGVATHVSCATVILGYKQALESAGTRQPSPGPATRLLAVSAVATFSTLAVFSVNLTVAALLGRRPAPSHWTLVTPFPCVLATLLTFGRLPAPIGGYARPASISIGLAVYFSIAAASAGGGRQ